MIARIETNPVKRNLAKTTRKRAIDAACAHCMGCTAAGQGSGAVDHLEPGFREAIRNCTATGCPLHVWRPYRKKSGGLQSHGTG